jgi:hypothetical protein
VPNQAVRRKALLNALSGCSSALKKQVAKRNILSRNKIPLSTKDIRKLVSAAGAGCSGADSVAVVTDVVE